VNINLLSVTELGKFCLTTIALFISTITTAKAQNNLPPVENTLNGLFSPTAAQRFFETGKVDFEREIDFVSDSENYFNDDILQLDKEELREPIEEIKQIQNIEQNNFSDN
jgi:hypothetical protein